MRGCCWGIFRQEKSSAKGGAEERGNLSRTLCDRKCEVDVQHFHSWYSGLVVLLFDGLPDADHCMKDDAAALATAGPHSPETASQCRVEVKWSSGYYGAHTSIVGHSEIERGADQPFTDLFAELHELDLLVLRFVLVGRMRRGAMPLSSGMSGRENVLLHDFSNN